MARSPSDYFTLPTADFMATVGDPNRPSACNRSTPAPSATDYWQKFLGTNTAYMTITILCIFATIFIVGLYCVKYYYIRVYVSSYRRASKMAWVAAIFPVTAVVSLVGITMPRTLQIVDIFIYLYFTRCLFTFVQLIADYFGGEVEMAKFLHDDPIALNTLPCCCCCTCLPRKKPTRELLRRIGILVYQVAILPPLIFFITAVIWVDQTAGVQAKSKFIAVIFPLLSIMQVISILLASYGTQIFTKMAAVSLHDYCIKKQMRFVQLMVLLYNIQGNLFNIASSTLHVIPCNKYLTSSDVASLWNHYLLIFEILTMALLAAWCLRPSVNATFDLHQTQLETHAAHRKIACFEEDFYVHEDELAENVGSNAARNRKIRISDALLETDVLRRQSLNPFAPRIDFNLYGTAPQIYPLPRNSVANGNASGGVPAISVITLDDERRISIPAGTRLVSISSSTKMPPVRGADGRLLSTSSSTVSGENRRKLSLLDVHHLPRYVSQGPWLQRKSLSVSSNEDPNKNVRQAIASISEEREDDDDDVFHPHPEAVEQVEEKIADNNAETVTETGNSSNANKPSVSVTEYLV